MLVDGSVSVFQRFPPKINVAQSVFEIYLAKGQNVARWKPPSKPNIILIINIDFISRLELMFHCKST